MEPRVRPSEIVIRPLEPSDDPAMHAIKIAEGNFPTTGIAPSTSLRLVALAKPIESGHVAAPHSIEERLVRLHAGPLPPEHRPGETVRKNVH